jgi:5'-3' exoribonuclease 1
MKLNISHNICIMGIPSYFSYIVKNHINIIRKYEKNSLKVHNFYLDCNSIIYDIIYKSKELLSNIDIIKGVILKIDEYIQTIEPTHLIYIAFDGVAPVAKLEQQRNRRYKSHYQQEISKSILKKSDLGWNTAAITPGTEFMKELNIGVSEYYSSNIAKYNVQNIIVSTSSKVGEGEHKIFDHIRNKDDPTFTSIVYGLDADLIMLAINHLPIQSQIYLFRETPEFIKSIDNSLEPNESYFLDIPLLSETITESMSSVTNNGTNESTTINRVYDYIFLCFFLGNDFMPHFPAVNIRTGGIDKMLGAYKATIGKTNKVLTDGNKIYWRNVLEVVEFLAKQEETYIKTEMKMRDRKEKYGFLEDTPEQKYAKFEALPTYERKTEKLINPFQSMWQERYYLSLFKMKITDERRKQICVNYMEGLEWTMKYYTSGCPDWRWCYKYNYPPLLQDLVKYIPLFDITFIEEKERNPVTELVQLCYVLPKHSLNLLPAKLYEILKDKEELYPENCEFVWAYCRYFWESHVELPEINIEDLEELVK